MDIDIERRSEGRMNSELRCALKVADSFGEIRVIVDECH
jgi:hypothetical protein